jgi:hypothetical protein
VPAPIKFVILAAREPTQLEALHLLDPWGAIQGTDTARVQSLIPEAAELPSPSEKIAFLRQNRIAVVADYSTTDLGNRHLKRNYDKATSHFEQAISIFREIKAENELALACSGMGRLHKLGVEYAEPWRYLTDAPEIFERLGTLIEPEKVRKELAEFPG